MKTELYVRENTTRITRIILTPMDDDEAVFLKLLHKALGYGGRVAVTGPDGIVTTLDTPPFEEPARGDVR